MPSSQRLSLAFLALLVGSSTCMAGAWEEEYRVRGPIGIRSPFPLDLISLDMTPDHGAVKKRGQWSVDLQLMQSNTYEITTGFDTLVPEFEAGIEEPYWRFIVDSELTRLNVDLAVGVAPRLELGLEVPVLSYGGGFLDSLIDDVHETLGLPDNDRHLRTTDDLDIDLIAGKNRYRLQDGELGIGDAVVKAKVALVDNSSLALAASVEIKLATGDEDELLGSGSTDYGLSLFFSTGGERHVFHGGLGYYWLGDAKALPVELEDRGSLMFAYEYLPAASWSLQSQLVASTSLLPDNPQLENEDPRLELSVGFTKAFEGFHLGAGFIENISTADNTADLSLYFSVGWGR